MFINKNQKPDVIKNYKYFLLMIKKLESYLVKFDKTS